MQLEEIIRTLDHFSPETRVPFLKDLYENGVWEVTELIAERLVGSELYRFAREEGDRLLEAGEKQKAVGFFLTALQGAEKDFQIYLTIRHVLDERLNRQAIQRMSEIDPEEVDGLFRTIAWEYGKQDKKMSRKYYSELARRKIEQKEYGEAAVNFIIAENYGEALELSLRAEQYRTALELLHEIPDEWRRVTQLAASYGKIEMDYVILARAYGIEYRETGESRDMARKYVWKAITQNLDAGFEELAECNISDSDELIVIIRAAKDAEMDETVDALYQSYIKKKQDFPGSVSKVAREAYEYTQNTVYLEIGMQAAERSLDFESAAEFASLMGRNDLCDFYSDTENLRKSLIAS